MNKKLIKEKHLYMISFVLTICFVWVVILCDTNLPKNIVPYALCKTSQDLWLAGLNNDCITRVISVRKSWESETTDFLIKNIKPSEVVIELGANIGYFTTLMAQLVGEQGKVYAYEANKEVYDLAVLSIKMNDFQDRVTIKNMIVSDENKDAMSFIRIPVNQAKEFREANLGGAHIKKGKNDCAEYEVNVPSVTLDDDLNIRKVDWIRMDIEGAEILALKGAKNIIKSSPNLKIVMEWSVRLLSKYGNIENLIDEMHSLGFKFYTIEKLGKVGKELSKTDLLYFKGLNNLVLLREKIDDSITVD